MQHGKKIVSLLLALMLVLSLVPAFSASAAPDDLERQAVYTAANGNIARSATVEADYSNGTSVATNANNGSLSTGTSSTAWNTWGTSLGSQTTPVNIWYTWSQPYTIDAMRVMWWIYTDSGVNWPRSCNVQYKDSNGDWVTYGAVGVDGNSNGGDNRPSIPISPWRTNTAWNIVRFDTPITTTGLRLQVYGSKTSGTSPGVGISEWEVFGASNPALADLASISNTFLMGLTENVTLPSTGPSGSVITWSDSTVPAALANDGTVVRPVIGQSDATGTITATAVNDTYTESKVFNFSVISLKSDAEIVAHDLAAISLGSLNDLKTSITLPMSGEWGSTITWSSSNTDYLWNDGTVIRPPAPPNAEITLTATASFGTEADTKSFSATISALNPGGRAITSVETINVECPQGTAPSLPFWVRVTYSDGTSGLRYVKWSNSTTSIEAAQAAYPVGREYTVSGNISGDTSATDGFQITANVTVVGDANDTPDSTPVAEPMPLSNVTINGSNRLTNNRSLAVARIAGLDVSQQLYNYRDTFGLSTTGYTTPNGWDSTTTKLKGHGSGHYMSALAFAYDSNPTTTQKTTLLSNMTRMVNEMRECQERTFVYDEELGRYREARDYMPDSVLNTALGTWTAFDTYKTDWENYGYGYINAIPAAHPALIERYRGYDNTSWVWAPYYSIHKQLAGLIDIHLALRESDDPDVRATADKALLIAKDMGMWIWNRLYYRTFEGASGDRTQNGNRTEMWNMYIAGELGGTQESMARIAELVTDPDEKAKLYEGASFFKAPVFYNYLAANQDDIRTRHANQHIPMITGSLRTYQGLEDPYWYNVAENFWNFIQNRYRYSPGGVGNGEMFRQPYAQYANIVAQANETCCAYNLAKLTKDLASYKPDDAKYMDYYERVLYNQLVGSIGSSYQVTYQYAVGANASKPYGNTTPQSTCCGGTGAENHVKYQEATYFVSDDTVWVNLYMPTTATWSAKNVEITQDCLWPAESSTITMKAITGETIGAFTMKLRVPYWATSGFDIKVNGTSVQSSYTPSSYVAITRDWSASDVVTVTMPFSKQIDYAPDKSSGNWMGTLMYGPLAMVSSGDTASLDIQSDLSNITANAADNGTTGTTGNRYTLTLGSRTFTPDYYNTSGSFTHYYTINMEAVGVDKRDLFDKLNLAKACQPAGIYTSESFAGLQSAITTAVNVYQNDNATKAQVSAQVTALQTAIDDLEVTTAVSITDGKKRIALDESVTFTTDSMPSDATVTDYAWSVSEGAEYVQIAQDEIDPSKVTVTGKTVGYAKLKLNAIVNDLPVNTEYAIQVFDPADVLNELYINGPQKATIGEELTYQVIIQPESKLNDCTIQWYSSNDCLDFSESATMIRPSATKQGFVTLTVEVDYKGEIYTAEMAVLVKDSDYIGNRLLDLIFKCQALNEADFTEASWAALSAAMADAIAVTSNESSTESQINGAYNKLAAAYAGLKSIINPGDVDKTVLAMYIATAEDILSSEAGELRPSSIKALQDALILAKYVNSSNSASQEMVDDMAYDLLWVIVNRKDIVDRSELKELIEIIERLNSSKYKEDGWAVLTEALASAKLVDDESSVAEVTNAYKALQNAFNGLVEIPVTNKSALLSALNNAKAILDDIDSFVPSSVAGLADLYAQAKAVYDSADSTQTQVNSITSQLVVANAKARAKADTTALVKALAQASSLKAANYTSASYAALASEMKAAQAVVGNVEVTQAEVDKKTTALNNAINGLVPVAASVKVSGLSKNMVVGETATATATVTPSNADKTVKWTSSDSKVASINATTGKITAKSAGKATITATVSGKTATYTITVHQYVSMKIGSTKAIQNGNKVTIDNAGTKPFKIGGRTMIPVRFVGEKMGGKVKYVSDSQPITMTYGDITVELKLGSKSMKVIQGGKSKTVTLDVAAQKKNGKTYIPLRAISESLGFAVYYEAGSEYIVVNSPAMSADVRNARLTEAKGYIK